jgi:hypothetical protein
MTVPSAPKRVCLMMGSTTGRQRSLNANQIEMAKIRNTRLTLVSKQRMIENVADAAIPKLHPRLSGVNHGAPA